MSYSLPTVRDLNMMRLAIKRAERAARMGEVPVGAVIYNAEGDILGTGYNRREIDHDPTAHAEMIALRDASDEVASWRLTGLSMAVTLEPCPMCAGAIINARLDRVVYGASDPKMGCVGSLYDLLSDTRFNHQPKVIPHVLAEESATLLREFFQGLRLRRE